MQIKCENCDESHKYDKWNNIRANSKGWTHQKDGRAFCPKHMPAWKRAKRGGL